MMLERRGRALFLTSETELLAQQLAGTTDDPVAGVVALPPLEVMRAA